MPGYLICGEIPKPTLKCGQRSRRHQKHRYLVCLRFIPGHRASI